MPHSHFRYLSNQSCWNYTDTYKFKAVTGTLFPQGHSWQIRPILLIKHYKNIPFIHRMDKSQLQLGDSSFAFKTCHGSYTLEDFRINSGALLQTLKCCRRQQTPRAPHSPASQTRDKFVWHNQNTTSKTLTTALLPQHGQVHIFDAKPQTLLLFASAQIHRPTTLERFLLRTATLHTAPPNSYKVSTSPVIH